MLPEATPPSYQISQRILHHVTRLLEVPGQLVARRVPPLPTSSIMHTGGPSLCVSLCQRIIRQCTYYWTRKDTSGVNYRIVDDWLQTRSSCTSVWCERYETSTVDDDDFKPKCQASTVHWFTQCPSRPVSSKQVRGIDGGRELGRRTRQRIPSPTRRTDGAGVQQPVTYNGVWWSLALIQAGRTARRGRGHDGQPAARLPADDLDTAAR